MKTTTFFYGEIRKLHVFWLKKKKCLIWIHGFFLFFQENLFWVFSLEGPWQDTFNYLVVPTCCSGEIRTILTLVLLNLDMLYL